MLRGRFVYTILFSLIFLMMFLPLFPNTVKIQFDSNGSFSEVAEGYMGDNRVIPSAYVGKEDALAYHKDESFTRYWMTFDWENFREADAIAVYLNQSSDCWITNLAISVGNIFVKNIEILPDSDTSNIYLDDNNRYILTDLSGDTSTVYLTGFYGEIGRYVMAFRAIYFILLLVVFSVIYWLKNTLEEKVNRIAEKVNAFTSGLKIKSALLILLFSIALRGVLGVIFEIFHVGVLSANDLTAFCLAEFCVMILFARKTNSAKHIFGGGVSHVSPDFLF